MKLGVDAESREPLLQSFHISTDDRPQERIDRRRTRAEVLAHLGAKIRGDRDRRFRKFFQEDLANTTLMHGVRISVKKTDRKGCDTFRRKSTNHLSNGALVERGHHAPGVVESLGNAATQGPRHERLRFIAKDVIETRSNLTTNLEYVAKTFGGDQRCLRSLSLDDGIGGDRRTVHDGRDLRSRSA